MPTQQLGWRNNLLWSPLPRKFPHHWGSHSPCFGDYIFFLSGHIRHGSSPDPFPLLLWEAQPAHAMSLHTQLPQGSWQRSILSPNPHLGHHTTNSPYYVHNLSDPMVDTSIWRKPGPHKKYDYSLFHQLCSLK